MLELDTADPPPWPLPCACSKFFGTLVQLRSCSSRAGSNSILLVPTERKNRSPLPSLSFFLGFRVFKIPLTLFRFIQTPHAQVFLGFKNTKFAEDCTVWILLSQFAFPG